MCPLQVLMTDPGAPPQIPHADDHWNRELFGVTQLLPNQMPTESIPYPHMPPAVPFPTAIIAPCELCGRYIEVPDRVARCRGRAANQPSAGAASVAAPALEAASGTDASTGRVPLTCADSALVDLGSDPSRPLQVVRRECVPPGAEAESAYARDTRVNQEHTRTAYAAFAPLLRPDETIAAMRPMGPGRPDVGDTLLALPTLIHRGPGNVHGATPRKVIFFSLRPKYAGQGVGLGAAPLLEGVGEEAVVGEYDSGTQLHAGWLLSRGGYALDAKAIRAVLQRYKAHGIDLESFGKGAETLRGKRGK